MNESHLLEWFSYWGGALLSLGMKYGRFLWTELKDGRRTWKTVTGEWLFDPSQANRVSWATTIGVVWVGGAIVVNGGHDFFGGWLPLSATHSSMAFLSGALMEMIAPELSKRAVKKFAPNFLKGENDG